MKQRICATLFACVLSGCAAPPKPAPPVSDNGQMEEAKRKFLENYKARLQRSPAYDEKSRAEAIRAMEQLLAQPPFDDIARFMTPERAEYVRVLRVEQGYTYRALAAACSQAWGANWGSNQLIGEDLWRAATKMLGIAFP